MRQDAYVLRSVNIDSRSGLPLWCLLLITYPDLESSTPSSSEPIYSSIREGLSALKNYGTGKALSLLRLGLTDRLIYSLIFELPILAHVRRDLILEILRG